MPQTKDISIFIQILQKVQRLQERYWREGRDLSGSFLSAEVRSIYESIAGAVCYPIKTMELEGKIKTIETDHRLLIGNLFLPPLQLDKKFIPIVSIDYDFRNSPTIMRLYVGMFSLNRKGRPKVFGFRFETAHTHTNHSYCHTQFTRIYKRMSDDKSFASLPTWVPEEIPCILVPANEPVSLFCCMLISFYGKHIWNQLLSDLRIDAEYFKTFECLNL